MAYKWYAIIVKLGFMNKKKKDVIRLKKLVFILVTTLLLSCFFTPAVMAEGLPEVTCEAYVIMDADTGQIIMEKNPDEILYPASITKIMTLALAMEQAQGDWSTQLTVSSEVTTSMELGSSHVALQPGEIVRLEDVIYATELESANDGANALAEYISDDGTILGGVEKMNAKAQELGLSNTHYVNPHGLHNEQHYTTARDMANLTRWAMSVPGFLDVFCRTEAWQMEATNIQPVRVFHCTDWLRVGGPLLYRSYVKGSKTGYHDQAMHTLVTYSQQNNMNLISVVLKSVGSNGHFKDTGLLLDYAFAHYNRVEIPADETQHTVPLVGGGYETIGELQVHSAAGSVLLNDAFSASDIVIQYNIPQQYILGQSFDAAVEYYLPENGLQPTLLGSTSLPVTGLADILSQNTYIPKKTIDFSLRSTGIVVGGTMLAIALMFGWRMIGKRGGVQKIAKQQARNTGVAPDLKIIVRERPKGVTVQTKNIYVNPRQRYDHRSDHRTHHSKR